MIGTLEARNSSYINAEAVEVEQEYLCRESLLTMSAGMLG